MLQFVTQWSTGGSSVVTVAPCHLLPTALGSVFFTLSSGERLISTIRQRGSITSGFGPYISLSPCVTR